MADTCGDVTHRAYELALGEGLGFWERSTQVSAQLGTERPRSGLRAALGGGRRQKAGQLMLHTFDDGLVVERLRGGVRGVHYASVTATLLDIEAAQGTPCVGLQLTLDDGCTLAVVAPNADSAQPLVELAGRCRASTPSRLNRREAAAILHDPAWI